MGDTKDPIDVDISTIELEKTEPDGWDKFKLARDLCILLGLLAALGIIASMVNENLKDLSQTVNAAIFPILGSLVGYYYGRKNS